MLAAASSDGTVSLLTYQNGPGWTAHKVWLATICTRVCCSLCGHMICLHSAVPALGFSMMWFMQVPNAHPLGVTAVSWAPAAPAGSLVSAKGPGQPEICFASSGADNTVKVPCLTLAYPSTMCFMQARLAMKACLSLTSLWCSSSCAVSQHYDVPFNCNVKLPFADMEVHSALGRLAAGWCNSCGSHRLGERCGLGTKLGAAQEHNSICRTGRQSADMDRKQGCARAVVTSPSS